MYSKEVNKGVQGQNFDEYEEEYDQERESTFDSVRGDSRDSWAQSIEEPPFRAYPVTGGITFTYGGLKVDEKALGFLTTNRSERSMSEEFYTTRDVEDSRTIPDKTPDTYVYDTGLQTLAQDSNYADAGIFSDTAGDQKGQMKVYVDFKKK